MGHHLPRKSILSSWALLLAYLSSAVADRNVTVNDGDPSIVYSPPGAWIRSAETPLDVGGSHMLTQNPNATASFNFTGIAIYFLSPLWPYNVNTAISLDSGPVTLIDLVDYSRPNTGQGPETAQSHVVWNTTGLSNTQHTLRISVGAGQPFAIVDGLIYTDTSPPTTTERVVASSTASQTSASSSSKPVLPIALGTVLGLLGLLLLLLALWFFRRKRQRPRSEAWTVSGSSVAGRAGPSGPSNGYWNTANGKQGYAMRQSGEGVWQNPRYGQVGMPPPPMPPQPAYGYNPYQYSGLQVSAAPSSYHPPEDRAPNRYQPGNTLSTITERSTPQMGEGRTPLANSPASNQSELGYYTAPASEGGVSTMSTDGRGYGVQIESKHNIPDYSAPLNQARTLERSTQGKGSPGRF